MILNFMKTFNVNGKIKPTNFLQKIEKGIKIHTVRSDVKNRWHVGRNIHFSTGSRSSNYNCFKKGICRSTQSIEINYYTKHSIVIDSHHLDESEIEEFAINDGFDSIEDFWAWFDQYKCFSGKIIHWTSKFY